VPEPSAAYGPPGSDGEVNVSVVVAPILPGFRLQSLGTPGEAAQRFLDTIVAPEGSNRQAALLSASER
jgi:PsbP